MASSSSTKYPVGDTPVPLMPESTKCCRGGKPAAPPSIPLPQEKHYGFVPHGLIGSKK